MIELRSVSHGYDGWQVLEAVDLTLRPGSFHVLTGPSGAGKTTLLRLAAGEIQPTAGTVHHFDEPLASMDRDRQVLGRRRIGVVPQDPRFIDHLTLAENVALPVTVAGGETRADDLADLLGWVGLADRADALPPELSGGERQRAALARAVIRAPDAILADEPTGHVDREMGLRLMRLLIELNAMGRAVLLATHDLSLIRALKSEAAVRVLRLVRGRLTPAGSDL